MQEEISRNPIILELNREKKLSGLFGMIEGGQNCMQARDYLNGDISSTWSEGITHR